jgi:hypothetical protein
MSPIEKLKGNRVWIEAIQAPCCQLGNTQSKVDWITKKGREYL